MPRKKRLVILISSIVLTLLIIIGILVFLYIKTDMFKSNETLFSKYLIQNFNAIEVLQNNNTQQTEEILNQNKYSSELVATVEYLEDIGTSNENKDNPINNLKLKINSQTDKQNNYYYKDMSIGQENSDLIKLEYLNQDKNYGIRLNGIKQFISIEDDGTDEMLGFNVEKINNTLKNIDIKNIIDFSKEEKETLKNTYMKILHSNISKDRYYKQANTLITVNNQDVQTNSYYIKLTIEELNNLYIKILEQITNDEIILSKIDNIENKIKENYEEYETEKPLREEFIENINEEIESIKNNNIGNEEVKITVYENGYKTVRTAIEESTEKTTIDIYNSIFRIDHLQMGETEQEHILKIENKSNNTEDNILIELEELNANEIISDLQLEIIEKSENNNISKNIKLEFTNEKSKLGLNIDEKINILNEFENQITLENDNIKLNDLNEEQKGAITQVVLEKVMSQVESFLSYISIEDFSKILQNIGVINGNKIEITDTVGVTETEKNRFNSSFEFFQSENLNGDNIRDLLDTAKNNFDNMSVILDSGSLEEMDTEKLSRNDQQAEEYNKSISEIIITIKPNATNKEKQEDIEKFLNKNSNKKYNVSLNYDENGLVKYVRIKVQKE